jgi:hypothetical protein
MFVRLRRGCGGTPLTAGRRRTMLWDMERTRLLLVLLLGLAGWSCGDLQPAPPPPPVPATVAVAKPKPPLPPPESPSERAARVHRDAFVLDAHADTLMRVVDDGYDLGARHDEGHVDFPRMVEGGVDGQVFAVWVDPDTHEGRLWTRWTGSSPSTRTWPAPPATRRTRGASPPRAGWPRSSVWRGATPSRATFRGSRCCASAGCAT